MTNNNYWFLGTGIALVLLGTIAITFAVFTTLASVIFLGWIFLASGILQIAHAVNTRQWSGFSLYLLLGTLSLIVGGMFIAKPGQSAIALTLLIALVLITKGIFRIIIALTYSFANQWWVLVNGILTTALGIIIFSQWPLSSPWVIGLFVGIDLIFNGWSLIMLSMINKRIKGF
jgi:uncharacterized membrane protein HdeD (DUF308 family)